MFKLELLSINPYNAEQCKHIVMSNFESNIKKKFSKWIDYDYNKVYDYYKGSDRTDTPRQLAMLSIIPCASFYYLNYLTEINPDRIIDIGCGMNFFKDIIPGVFGIDKDGSEIDSEGVFDDNFSAKFENQFASAFSIDALHFIPITEFYNQVMRFVNVIQPGGRGYIALNSARMIDMSSIETLLETFNTREPTKEQITSYIDKEIRRLSINWLVVDNLIIDAPDEFLDGNIRLVFKK